MLSSLIAQLALQDQKAMNQTIELWKEHTKKRIATSKLTEEALSKTLQMLAIYFSKVTLIIDGLDECLLATIRV